MTHTEKLQQIFEAALKDNSEFTKPLTRAFPTSPSAQPVAVSQPAPAPEPEPEPVIEVPAAPAANAGLSDAASAELGALLEEQHQRKTNKHRRETVVTLAVVLVLTGGGAGWFVQSPQRLQAMKEAVHDIRSVGDVKSIVAKYQAALEKIGDRSKQIDHATVSMGVNANQDDAVDPNMNAEMLALMGGKGKTTGERNQMVWNAFGSKKDTTEAKNDPQPTAAVPREYSVR